jgi:hypothetical protein
MTVPIFGHTRTPGRSLSARANQAVIEMMHPIAACGKQGLICRAKAAFWRSRQGEQQSWVL